jgi:hypothetical protein
VKLSALFKDAVSSNGHAACNIGSVIMTGEHPSKCTLVQALRLCTGRTANRGSRGIALLFHDQRH